MDVLIRKTLKEAARHCLFPEGKNALARLEWLCGRKRSCRDEGK